MVISAEDAAATTTRRLLNCGLPRQPHYMVDDYEVWACANELMRQHGSDAWFWAAQRADELLVSGELDGHRTFQRILARIEQLEQVAPQGGLQ